MLLYQNIIIILILLFTLKIILRFLWYVYYKIIQIRCTRNLMWMKDCEIILIRFIVHYNKKWFNFLIAYLLSD